MSRTLIWKNQQREFVNPDEWNRVLNEFESKGVTRIDWSEARRIPYYYMHYMLKVDESGTNAELRWFDENGTHRYICGQYVCSEDYSDGLTGKDCFDRFEHLWQKLYGEHQSIAIAFGSTTHHTEYWAIKQCVPHQIAWITRRQEQVFSHTWKADVSSAFPYQLCKTLPTLKDCKTVKGKQQPTKEYPFAFYPDTGNLSIYNELSTQQWDQDPCYKYFVGKQYAEVCKPWNVQPSYTILCKASEYSFEKVLKLLYSKRNENSDNKKVMNATIGFMHRNNSPFLSMIPAVVIARSNQRMLDYANKLARQNKSPIYIATDSIVWAGGPSDIVDKKKDLGAFVLEAEDVEFYGVQVGSYQLRDKEGKVTTLCSYMKNDETKQNLPFGKLEKPKTKYVLDKRSGKIIQVI